MKKNKIGFLKNIAKTFSFPIVLWILFLIMTMIFHKSGYASAIGIDKVLRESVQTSIIAFAIAIPLSSGRWDFGVGAIISLAGIIGSNLTIQCGGNIIVLLVLTVLTALILSVIEGAIYVTSRISITIVSLGVVMLYEALTGILFGGNGAQMFRYDSLNFLSRAPWCYIIFAVVAVVIYILLKYTKYGYDTKSLASNAKLAINNGVNEKKNVMLTYVLTGVLLGIAAVLNASVAVVSPESNLSSTSLMFSSMGPVLVGLYLSRFSNMPLGIFAGALGMSSLSFGMAVLGFHSSLQTIILGIFIVGFMGYTSNIDKISRYLKSTK